MDTVAQMAAASAPGQLPLEQALLGLLLAFILGQVAAWAYMYTHTGLSYSSAFVQSIILLTVLISLAMMVIGSNIVIAFGLIGALAVIRFRNILKDTRDTAFIFRAGYRHGDGDGQRAPGDPGYYRVLPVALYLRWRHFGNRARRRLSHPPDTAQCRRRRSRF